jgi:hypothetical protein
MAKLRITFEVDTIALFNRIRELKGNCTPLGDRIVGAMITGRAGFADSISMAIYGVTVVDVGEVPE